MRESNIPLPPPEGHRSDCTCEACYESKVDPEKYSIRVLNGLARKIVPKLGADVSIWFLWPLNQDLPHPLTLDKILDIVMNAKSAIGEGKLNPRPMLKSKSRPFKGVGFE